MLDARNLTKRYNSILAVENVTFTIRPGEILDYLGPNGSSCPSRALAASI